MSVLKVDSRILLLCLTCLWVTVQHVSAAKIQRILFIGGTEIMDGYGQVSQLKEILEILFSGTNEDDIQKQLVAMFDRAPFLRTPVENSMYMANELIQMKRNGLIKTDFEAPLVNTKCTSCDVQDCKVGARGFPIAPNAKCGHDFGPELTLGHVMVDWPQYKDDNSGISVTKLHLYQYTRQWSEPDYWSTVQTAIQAIDTSKEEWSAIVWAPTVRDGMFELIAELYQDEVTQLVQDLRAEVHKTDTSRFKSPADIPVAVVGLPCPEGLNRKDCFPYASMINGVCQDFAERDANAIFVSADNLACGGIMDVASYLILGKLITEALQPLLPLPSEDKSPPSGTLPDWWKSVKAAYTGSPRLLKCTKLKRTPVNGSQCTGKAKTCFFGNQKCPDVNASVSSYPTVQCQCKSDGLWSCNEVECKSIE